MAARATSTKAKSAPVEEPEDDEFEDVEEMEDEDLEDLEEVGDDEDEAPAKPVKATKTTKATAKAASAPKFGSAELAAYITEQTGENYDGRSVRMLLRKLAADGKLERVVGETRDRYSFTGPNDPTVKAVLAMVKSGEAKAMKQAGLQAVKAKADARRAAAKAAKATEVEDAEEVVEETKPRTTTRTRKAAPTKTAPAKATPTTRRRASTTP